MKSKRFVPPPSIPTTCSTTTMPRTTGSSAQSAMRFDGGRGGGDRLREPRRRGCFRGCWFGYHLPAWTVDYGETGPNADFRFRVSGVYGLLRTLKKLPFTSYFPAQN